MEPLRRALHTEPQLPVLVTHTDHHHQRPVPLMVLLLLLALHTGHQPQEVIRQQLAMAPLTLLHPSEVAAEAVAAEAVAGMDSRLAELEAAEVLALDRQVLLVD